MYIIPKAKGGEGATVDGMPAFLRAKNLKDFISNDLIASTTPVEFVPLRGPGGGSPEPLVLPAFPGA